MFALLQTKLTLNVVIQYTEISMSSTNFINCSQTKFCSNYITPVGLLLAIFRLTDFLSDSFDPTVAPSSPGAPPPPPLAS